MSTDARGYRQPGLMVIGASLMFSGLCSVMVILSASFGRYMHVEDLDLGLDDTAMHQVTQMTAMDKGWLVVSVALLMLGVAVLLAVVVRGRTASARDGLPPS